MSFTDYAASVPSGPGGGSPAASGKEEPTGQGWDLSKLKRAVSDYLGNKSAEIEEQKNSRRYYHASQWTAEQIAVLKKRNQPAMTFNRVARKIDAVVGLIERLRQDVKAYPRTPQQDQGADLATAAVRYVLDEQRWKEKSPEVARDGAIDGIAGIEINIEAGDQGDPEINFEIVEPDSYIYDPRSYRADFSDASYQGISKWLDLDIAQSMFPGVEFGNLDYTVGELTSNPDRERRWFDSVKKRVRVVDLWYQRKGAWHYCLFTGAQKLMEGQSYLKDEKGKTFCKYIMYSANIDQDGDRYSFIRNMKSAQDGINARQSKLQHILSSRRLILQQGAIKDIEAARREWARPDGVVVTVGPVNEGAKADDQSFDFAGWSKMMEMSITEIENFGPNPALIGQGIENSSGRAISLLQQAGIAELGPYILSFRGWKLRVYRAIWNALRQHWTKERWIRVTDDEGLGQFVSVNKLGVDPNTGMPAIINQLAALDVDIIIDEGPDSINIQADTYETLKALAQSGVQIPPEALIEVSPLPGAQKKKLEQIMQQSAQAAQQAKQQEFQQEMMLKKGGSPSPEDMQQEMQLKAAQMQQDGQLQREKVGAEIDLKRAQTAADIELDRQKAAAQIEIEQQKVIAQSSLSHQKHFDDMQMERERMALQQENSAQENDNKLSPIKEIVAAMTKPKRARKMPDGSWLAEVVDNKQQA